MQIIDENDMAVGEAGTREPDHRRRVRPRREGQAEYVLVQSDARTVDDPAFRADRPDRRELSSFPQVTNLLAPQPATRGRSRRTAMRCWCRSPPRGTYDEAALYIDAIIAAVDEVQKAHPTSTSPRPASRPGRRSRS